MKTNFTKRKIVRSWFLLIVCIFFIPATTFAQTKYTVEVTNFRFEPRDLVINVDDTVEWINLEGVHNVNGNQLTYPGNPVSFGNEIDSEWTYSFVFQDQGLYNYQCDVHAIDGMLGTVTVNDATGIETYESNKFEVYPNPASDKVWIDMGDANPAHFRFEIHDIMGKSHTLNYRQVNQKMELDINSLQKGIYILEMTSPEAVKTMKLIKN